MKTVHDPGLRAVARVRSVRERDSRIGLVRALADERQLAERLTMIREHLATLAPYASGDLGTFLDRQRTVLSWSEVAIETRHALESAETVTMAARERWTSDKSRLAAVETLLANRAAERRAERAKREERDLDETAIDVWRRGHAKRVAREEALR
ncbi:flagellar FliJ family protein [Nocardioides pacificus]